MPSRISPTKLSNWPWVVVRLDCVLCTRKGCYRLARLTARYGPEHRAEHQDEGYGFAVAQIVQTLETAGCVFVAQNEGSGVMLRNAPKL